MKNSQIEEFHNISALGCKQRMPNRNRQSQICQSTLMTACNCQTHSTVVFSDLFALFYNVNTVYFTFLRAIFPCSFFLYIFFAFPVQVFHKLMSVYRPCLTIRVVCVTTYCRGSSGPVHMTSVDSLHVIFCHWDVCCVFSYASICHQSPRVVAGSWAMVQRSTVTAWVLCTAMFSWWRHPYC